MHTLQASPQVVFTYLTDMNLFASLHPVISKIDSKGNGQYLVFETLKIGTIPFSFTYPVVLRYDFAKSFVHIKAIIFKLATVEMSFILSTENDHTTIEENIYVKSIPLLNSLIIGIIKTQHLVLFNNLAIHLDHPFQVRLSEHTCKRT